MDPFLTALGIELAAGSAVDTAKALAAALLGWAKGDEVTRLFVELERHFENVPGVSATGLEPLRHDTHFLQLLAVYWRSASFPRDEMVAAIEPHLGPTNELTAHELSEQVADAISLFSARAREGNQELFATEAFRQRMEEQFAALRQELRAPATLQHFTVDWAPPLTRRRLEEMLKDDATNIAPLYESLRELEDPRATIRGLISSPPAWLEQAAHETWEALGELADGYGLWLEAGRAWEQAAERPGADRPPLLARAGEAHALGGDDTRAAELFDAATALGLNEAQSVLAQLRTLGTPEARLEALAPVPAQDVPRRQAALDLARAAAHLELHDWDAADAALAAVQAIAPDNARLRDLRGVLAVVRAQEQASKGSAVDVAALREAAQDTLALRDDLLEAFRFEESGRLLARSATALALAGETAEAAELLEQIPEEEKENRDVRLDFVSAALNVGRPDLALALAPEDPQTEQEELALAEAAAFSNNAASVAQAVIVLDRLLGSEVQQVRAEAAFARQVAALDEGVEPSDAAQAILEQESPALAALLAAVQLRRAGQQDAATAALLPHHDDPRILRELLRWAGQEEDWDKVLELSRALVAGQPVPLDRLVFGDALGRTGNHQEAVAEFTALRRDQNVPRDIRDDAYAYSARITAEAFDFQGLERVTREWIEFDENNQRPVWYLIHALLRLARASEAARIADERQLEPERVDEAELLAAVLDAGADRELAARRIGELSDRFDRPEQLEALFLIACTRVRPEERLEDLREQLQERWAAFPKNYPESRLIQSVPIDTSSPEGIDAFFHEHVRPGAEQVQNLSEQVVRGEMAIAPLAAVAGRAVSLITLQLGRAMPLGFHDTVLEGLERESAAQSVTRAVVWDPVALAIVASLPHEISELIRLAFPASLTAQATLDDLRRASDRPASDQDEESTLGFNPVSGEGFVRRRPAEEVTRESDAVTRAIEIAQTLQIKPDVDPARPTEIDQFLSEEDRDASFVTWPATLALAEREQKPIFSDDRYVRAQARRSGLAAFGTLAALDALAARALISEEQRRLARSLLRLEGAIGVGATLDELLAEGREANWSLTSPGLAFALLDPTSWAQNTVETYRIWSALLRTVFDERPDEFENWVWRFLDAANRNLPGRSPGFYAETLLLIAWQPYNPPDQAFFEALVAALRNGRNVFGWYDDPLLGASRRMLELSRTEDGKLRASLLRVVLAVLGFREQLALLGLDLNQR